MNTMRDLHVSATTLCGFGRMEVYEKIVRPWTFSPGNFVGRSWWSSVVPVIDFDEVNDSHQLSHVHLDHVT